MSDMTTRAERVIDRAAVIAAGKVAKKVEDERLEIVAREKAQQEEHEAWKRKEAKRVRMIVETWKGTGVIELFQEIAQLKEWKVQYVSENDIRLGYDNKDYEGGMESGDGTRYETSRFACVVWARREMRNRLFRLPEQRWIVGDKQIGVDGTLEDLVIAALADKEPTKKTAGDGSNFQKGDWDCWRP